MPESHPVALSFEVTETRGGPSAANGVTITSVERDDFAIHVKYDVVPPPDRGSYRARGEASTVSLPWASVLAQPVLSMLPVIAKWPPRAW
jgi:hypothetical protein